MSDFRSIVSVFSCQVHWGDCDPAGIIFYPTYFRWMDAAAWALLESVGYDARRRPVTLPPSPLPERLSPGYNQRG